ncbi:MAG TPA: GTP-binding protein [Chthoniobacterales bacterium]|nr:GTP-binding protein [Chthoniobacterales bacterium]
MAIVPGRDGGVLSVSIMAGPAREAAMEMLTGARLADSISVFAGPPGAQPEELVRSLDAIAEKGEERHLVLLCEKERPVMAYASLFLENASLPTLARTCRLTSVALALDSNALLQGGTCFLIEQLEFASDIFIQASSDDKTFELARSIALTLNPRARIELLTAEAIEGWIRKSETAFDFEAALGGAGWRQLIDESSPRLGHPGVVAFHYTARRPFHPGRFSHLLQHEFTGVLRAKGFFWLATRMDEVGGLNLAGSEVQCSSAGNWWATRDRATRESEMPERTKKEWQEPFGDRRQSFAVIALENDRNVLRSRLDACLLTEAEMNEGEKNWANLADPFPSWSSHAHHHHECGHEPGKEHDCCQH